MENFLVNQIQRLRQEVPAWKSWLLLSSPVILVGLFILIYYSTFQWFWWRWFRPESYYDHGPLIPLLSALLIWRQRKQLKKIPIRLDNLGLLVLIGGLLMHLLSAWMRIHFTSGFSLLIVLTGLVWYLFGWQMTRTLWFPLFFLLFMVPMPMDLISKATLQLKLFAAGLGSSLTNFLGTPNIREGSVIFLPNTTVSIDAPCSGLRSLITFMAMGSLYAYIATSQKVLSLHLRRWTLVLLCVPVAIFANLVRVVAILIISNRYGTDIITNDFLHKGFGLMVFVVGLITFFLIAKMLKLELPFTSPDQESGVASLSPRPPSHSYPFARWFKPLGISCLLLGLVGVMTFGAYSDIMDGSIRYTERFPEKIGVWYAVNDLYAQDPEMAKITFEILETEDTIYRRYSDLSGNSVDLVIVYSPHNRKVSHPPDICFQGGGWQQQIKGTIPAPYGGGLGLSQVNQLVLDKGGAKQIALYWYKSGNQQTSSYLSQQFGYLLNSVLRRKSRSVALIRLTTYTASADQIQPKTQQLEAFAKEIVPLIDRIIP